MGPQPGIRRRLVPRLLVALWHVGIVMHMRFMRITRALFAAGVHAKGKDLAPGMVPLSRSSSVTRL